MAHEDIFQEVSRRMARVEGHSHAVRRMFEEGKDCPQVLQQIAAVQKAWDKIASLIFESHVKGCIGQAIERGRGDEALESLREALVRFLR